MNLEVVFFTLGVEEGICILKMLLLDSVDTHYAGFI